MGQQFYLLSLPLCAKISENCQVFQLQMKEEKTVCKCEFEIRRNTVFEYISTSTWERGGGVVEGWCKNLAWSEIYSILQKGIKKTQNKSMENTKLFI